ncbi:beta-1,3 exoglucanase precursor-like protein [Cladochytrium replicatum]|nr:beta-1,3 exoglucanase precursor-like protein [Cladochytrium replicatum]
MNPNGAIQCASFCSPYTFAGTEYNSECCMYNCGNTLDSFTFGTGCTRTCTGNTKEICGGDYQVSVIFKDTVPSSVKVPSGSRYIGCFVDSRTNRRLPSYVLQTDTAMTPPKCTAECKRLGLRYAGLEYGQECWCGSTISYVASGLVATSQCSMACKGDTTALCGNADRVLVYDTQA